LSREALVEQPLPREAVSSAQLIPCPRFDRSFSAGRIVQDSPPFPTRRFLSCGMRAGAAIRNHFARQVTYVSIGSWKRWAELKTKRVAPPGCEHQVGSAQRQTNAGRSGNESAPDSVKFGALIAQPLPPRSCIVNYIARSIDHYEAG
jgi:hypothetical protein